MSNGLALLVVVCFTVLAFYTLLYFINFLDRQIQKRFHDSIDPGWWWKGRQE